jgi:hypothetical protein
MTRLVKRKNQRGEKEEQTWRRGLTFIMVNSTRITKKIIPFYAIAPPAISVKDSIKTFEYTFLLI